MKKIAKMSFLTLLAAAGCTANQASQQLNAKNADAAIFQQGAGDVAGVHTGLLGSKVIALTFDDGPQRGLTDALLDFLGEQDVKATFFMVGKLVVGNDYLLERMSDEGHSLGNHTFDHKPIKLMSKTNMNGVYQEIAQDDDLISPHLRSGKHVFFRPPGGSWTSTIANAMNTHDDISEKYIGPVNWDIGGDTIFIGDDGKRLSAGEPLKMDASTNMVTFGERDPKTHKIVRKWQSHVASLAAAADWQCDAVSVDIPTPLCLQGYMNEIERKQGGIVLLHDIHPRTIEMVKLMIPLLKAKGYSFITLDELPNIQKFE